MAGKSLRVGSVFVDYKSNDAQFQAAAKRTRTAVNKLKREIRPMIQTVKRLTVVFAGLAAGSGYAAKRIADQIDTLTKFSRSVRGTVKDMQILSRAADLQGIEFSKLQVSLKKFDVVLGQLSDGTAYKLITDQWDKLGLKVEDVINLPLEERVRVIIDAMNRYVPAAERAATASALFGSRNAGMILQLAKGGAIQRATREIEEYGGALTETQKIGVEGFVDALGELQHAIQVFSFQVVAKHAPAMRRWAERVADGLKEGGRLRSMFERIARAGAFLVETITNMVEITDKYITETTTTIAKLGLLAVAIGKITRMVMAFRNAILAAGIVTATLAGGLPGLVLALGSLAAGFVAVEAIMKTLDDGAADHNVTLSKMNDNYTALVETLDRAKDGMKGVWQETVRATQASLDQMDVELEQRAARLGRSEEYQDILKGIAQAEKDEAQARADLEGAQADTSIGFGIPGALKKQRQDAVDAQRRAALARIEEAKARRASFEATRQQRWGEIEREEQELADIRRKVQGQIAEKEEREIKKDAAPAPHGGLAAQYGYQRSRALAAATAEGQGGLAAQYGYQRSRAMAAAVRAATRRADISNKDTVYGPIGLRKTGGEGPDMNRIADLQRQFADDNPFVKTDTYEKLRNLRIEYAAIRQEIAALGPQYANLGLRAEQSFEAAKRHAMGVTLVTEEMIMLADSVKDRMRGVVDSAVDDFFDGTKKMGDAWRSLMRQIVKDAVWMRARSMFSAIGNQVFGGIGTSLFPTAAIPGANPGVALGGPPGIPSFAQGGQHEGGWARVGENGPELAYFNGPARIYDAAASRGMMKGQVDVNMALSGDVSAIADQIRNQIGAAAGPLAQQIMAGVQEQIRTPSDTRRAVRGAVA